MSLIKATRAKDGKTVWVAADKVNGVDYVAPDAPKPAPKARTRKNATSK
jgi:hypothetical protein